jgi:hypothetical protein
LLILTAVELNMTKEYLTYTMNSLYDIYVRGGSIEN